VNDLKHGADASGGVGLWVDIGTEGHFTNLHIEDLNAIGVSLVE